MVAEIHLANIYFTDASNFKIRPILILRYNSFNDVLYMPLSSNLKIKGVHITNANLSEGFLPKNSVVVYEKIGVIAQELIVRKIGTLSTEVFGNILDEFIEFFQE